MFKTVWLTPIGATGSIGSSIKPMTKQLEMAANIE
jgi:hypothetical protein